MSYLVSYDNVILHLFDSFFEGVRSCSIHSLKARLSTLGPSEVETWNWSGLEASTNAV